MEPSSAPLLRRIRWGNLARLIAVPAAVLAVVGWSRLGPPPPAIPAASPRPVAVPRAPRAAPEQTVPSRGDARPATHAWRSAPRARPAERPARRRAPAAVRQPRRAEPAGERDREAERPAPAERVAAARQTPAAPPSTAPIPAAPPPDPVADEFALP